MTITYTYLDKIRAFNIMKKKKVNVFMLSLTYSVVQYNVMVEKENKLNDEEYSFLKVMIGD